MDLVDGMKFKLTNCILVAVAATVLIGRSSPAYAYIEPGTVSIILQVLLGGLAGGLVMIRLFWDRLKARFMPGSKATGSTSELSDEAGEN